MARLIDADTFLQIVNNTGADLYGEGYGNQFESGFTRDAIREMLDETPTMDAVEVVHGRWKDFCRGKMCCCSACKAEFDNTCNDIHGEWKFCPNCGAKMDGERKDNE